MKRASSQPLLRIEGKTDEKEEEEEKLDEEGGGGEGQEEDDVTDEIAERFNCISLRKREFTKRGEEVAWEKYGLRRQEQKIQAARIDKQLKANWELDCLIQNQLRRYDAHYHQALAPSNLKDMAHLLMPKSTPPWEIASLAWFGDWRPSAILNLLRALSRSSSSSPSSSSLSDSSSNERSLSQLIHDTRIEEAVLDEEMAEIQANCILHLPFIQMVSKKGIAMACVQSELKKVDRVISKAQELRYKTLQLAVKKLLSQTEAAEFLVAFAAIQDNVHQIAAHQRLRKGPVSVPTKIMGL